MGRALVGRSTLVRRLTSRLAAAQGRDVVLVGDAGVGKTHLSAAIAAQIEGRGWEVHRVVATDAAGSVPFGAVAALVPPGADTPLAALQATAAQLAEVTATTGRRHLLTVDDAHHLDPASAALVHQLVLRDVARLLATVRSGVPVPDAITSLWKDAGASRTEVGPLTRSATDELATAILGGPPTERTATALWQRTRGNPLFVEETLRGALEAGNLVERHGRWQHVGPLVASTRLLDLISTRLADLEPEAELALAYVALAEPIGLTELIALTSGDAVAWLERRRLLVADTSADGRTVVRSVHPLHAEVIRARLGAARRRELAGDLADLHVTLDGGTGGGVAGPDASRLTLWRLEAGRPVTAAEALAAGERSLAGGDPARAEQLAHAAVRAGAELEGQLLLARAVAHVRGPEAAEPAFGAAAALAVTPDEHARTALAQAEVRLTLGGDALGAANRLEAVADAVVGAADWRDEVDAQLALYASFAGDLRRAAAVGDRVLARPDASDRALVATLVTSSVAVTMLGRFEDARRQLELARDREPLVRDELPFAALQLQATDGMLTAYASSIADALDLLRAGMGRAAAAGQPDASSFLASTAVHVAAVGGHAATALALAEATAASLLASDPLAMLPALRGHAAYAAAQRGDRATAATWLADVSVVEEATDRRARFAATLARAQLAVLDGEVGRASALVLELADDLAPAHPVWAAIALSAVVRAGRPEEAVPRLRELETRSPEGIVGLTAAHADALARREAAALEAVAARYAAAGAPRLAVESQLQAVRAYRRRRDQDGERRATVGVASYVRIAGADAPPSAAQAVWPLTAREEQLARLAGAGWTNREIAAELGLSVRTVENHLAAVYRRLDIAGRSQLPAIFSGVPAPSDDQAPGGVRSVAARRRGTAPARS